MSVRRRFVAVAGAVALSACAANSAPGGFLLSPEMAQSESWGGWIELQVLAEGQERTIAGELIATTRDTVWILDGSGGQALPTSTVQRGKLTAYSAEVGRASGATVAGAVSTLANGWLLVFSAPMWIMGGTLESASQSRVPVYRSPPWTWKGLAAFARFPAGMPPGVQLADLHPKER